MSKEEKIIKINSSEDIDDNNNERKFLFSMGRKETYQFILVLYGLVMIGAALIYTASLNPNIFTLHKDTLLVITDAYNIVVILAVPLLFGILGASSRVMLSGLKVIENLKLVFSSGLMASFSWLGIKSKIFLALVAPYVTVSQAQDSQDVSVAVSGVGNEIYSMILVSVVVGMFSSNLYLFVYQRVERLTGGARVSLQKNEP
ncbi:hypothetical protein ACJJIX_11730 [Microbulbifer sp. VAAC004]|uniref:hypothetical protein n=1 Tax=unclassified Microbulbifer TaxID=2619833 RepID=UPI00403978F7